MKPRSAKETAKENLEVTQVDPRTAQELYFKHFPLKYSVSDKIIRDHVTSAPNLSKQTSINEALDRYVRDRGRTPISSWILLSSQTLINKATNARKMASVHAGKQQMTLEIAVTRRTVTLTRLTDKDRRRYEYKTIKVGQEVHYLNCASDERELKICIMGQWSPLTGNVVLYHYEEGALPATPQLLPQYLSWTRSKDKKQYVAPAAKK